MCGSTRPRCGLRLASLRTRSCSCSRRAGPAPKGFSCVLSLKTRTQSNPSGSRNSRIRQISSRVWTLPARGPRSRATGKSPTVGCTTGSTWCTRPRRPERSTSSCWLPARPSPTSRSDSTVPIRYAWTPRATLSFTRRPVTSWTQLRRETKRGARSHAGSCCVIRLRWDTAVRIRTRTFRFGSIPSSTRPIWAAPGSTKWRRSLPTQWATRTSREPPEDRISRPPRGRSIEPSEAVATPSPAPTRSSPCSIRPAPGSSTPPSWGVRGTTRAMRSRWMAPAMCTSWGRRSRAISRPLRERSTVPIMDRATCSSRG